MSFGNDTYGACNGNIRSQLADIYANAADVMRCVYPSDEFLRCSAALNNATVSLNDFLNNQFRNLCKTTPIISESFTGKQLIEDLRTIGGFLAYFHDHPCKMECAVVAVDLEGNLNLLCFNLKGIWNWLNYDIMLDAACMAQYGKQKLDEYRNGAFLLHHDDRSELFVPYRDTQKIVTACENAERKIKELFAETINAKGSKIFYEALGRYLWSMRSKSADLPPEESILFWIMVYEYYVKLSGYSVRYLVADREVREGQRAADPRNLAEPWMKKIRSAIVDNCKNYFVSIHWRTVCGNMLDDMLDCDCKKLVYEKLDEDKYIKFAHQIAGLLYDYKVFDGCTRIGIAREMKLSDNGKGTVSDETRAHYMRDAIDVPDIANWICDYLKKNGASKRK